ncbi:ATP-grasp domain-containing protein [Sanyastnella coralliicola]|uniref:ATP-grasp domain-containing protein n=1 Tax=Sanyastnella coralliicola TaxID=3069118 RepID=UPI0027B92C1C|nr:hypothetical protein [Longitalea sp. SCSIO 12813]
MKVDVTILTEAQYVQPEKTDWYIDQVLLEDRLVMEALERKGLSVQKKDWADPATDWGQTKVAIFRTTWDYFHRFPEFKQWIDSAGEQTTFVNAKEQILWNIDKHYMADLEKAGVRIVTSDFRQSKNASSYGSLNEWCSNVGGEQWVLKPTISGAARHTYKLSASNIAEHETIYRELLAQEDMMLQPFQYNIEKEGELSLMVMNGQYTHAIRKIAKAGDFRVQDDFGGSVHHHQASAEEIAFAEAAVAACELAPMYARVDMIKDNQGELALGELELIEPELWFREHPAAADVLAEGVMQLLGKL